MNVYTSVAIINVAIISLVGFGIYITHDFLPLLALFFMVRTSSDKDKKEE